jgi:hypothetical protein
MKWNEFRESKKDFFSSGRRISIVVFCIQGLSEEEREKEIILTRPILLKTNALFVDFFSDSELGKLKNSI